MAACPTGGSDGQAATLVLGMSRQAGIQLKVDIAKAVARVAFSLSLYSGIHSYSFLFRHEGGGNQS